MEDKRHLDSTSPTPGAWELPGPDGARSLEQLDQDIAVTSAHIAAATHRLLTDIAEFDRREGQARAPAPSGSASASASPPAPPETTCAWPASLKITPWSARPLPRES